MVLSEEAQSPEISVFTLAPQTVQLTETIKAANL